MTSRGARPSTTVLVVEDHPDMLLLLSRMLTARCKVRVVEACDAFRAYEILHYEQLAAVVSDIDLPGLSGFELLAVAKRMVPDLPFFLVTASPEVHAARATQSGADGFFPKPIDYDALTASVRAVVGVEASEV